MLPIASLTLRNPRLILEIDGLSVDRFGIQGVHGNLPRRTNHHLTRWQYLLFDQAPYNRLAHVEAFRGHLKSYFAGLIILRKGWQVVEQRAACTRLTFHVLPTPVRSLSRFSVPAICWSLNFPAICRMTSIASGSVHRRFLPASLFFTRSSELTPASPVNQENNFSAFLLHPGNDLADQNPYDALLESHVS